MTAGYPSDATDHADQARLAGMDDRLLAVR